MKKFLILFLALTFVFSIGTFVFADDGGAVASMTSGSSVSISGDARVRGIWQSNYNFTDTSATGNTNDADVRNWDQRIRLNVTGNVGNGIEVRTRLTTGTTQWDGTNNTGANAVFEIGRAHV